MKLLTRIVMDFVAELFPWTFSYVLLNNCYKYEYIFILVILYLLKRQIYTEKKHSTSNLIKSHHKKINNIYLL